MTPSNSPSHPTIKGSRNDLLRKDSNFVEYSQQLRIGDLLHWFKKCRRKFAVITLVLKDRCFKVSIDITNDAHPVCTIRVMDEDHRDFVSQVVPLQIFRPPLGGWSANFLCPLVREDGSRCGKEVRCLYLPAPYSGRQFGCRACNHLTYIAQAKRKGLAKTLRDERRALKTLEASRPKNRHVTRGTDLLPLEIPDGQWYSEIPSTEEESQRINEVLNRCG